MPIDRLQDDEMVKCELSELTRMMAERAPYENNWRDVDARVNPFQAGGFNGVTPGARRGQSNFDVTASESRDRFGAAMVSISVPKRLQYINVKFADANLNKLPSVKRWCAAAGPRLYAIRYAPHTGFGRTAFETFCQVGGYGNAPLWHGERPGTGVFYQSLHLAECFFDVDFSGRVDTVRRSFRKSARQCEQMFGRAALTPKMLEAITNDKGHLEFELIHAVRPSEELNRDAMDYRSMPVASIYIARDEKMVLKRSGYHSMPISVARDVTSPGEKYSHSPSIRMMPTIMGVNVMQQTILRAGHKAVDPALAFYNDDGMTSLSTKPNGLNPGLVDENGRLLVAAMPGGGGNIPMGMEMVEQERAIIRRGFMGEYWKLLAEDSVQRSATAVLEIAAKQGALIAPYGEQFDTDVANPVTQRDLELALRAGQIDPFPPEVIEAGAWPLIEYDNPLSRMARAEEPAGLTRMIEVLAPFAQSRPDVFDVIDIDKAAPEIADVLGVNANWIRSPEDLAAVRKSRTDAQAAQQGVDQFATAAGAYVDIAKGNQLAEAA